jgi:hypothetical protein
MYRRKNSIQLFHYTARWPVHFPLHISDLCTHPLYTKIFTIPSTMCSCSRNTCTVKSSHTVCVSGTNVREGFTHQNNKICSHEVGSGKASLPGYSPHFISDISTRRHTFAVSTLSSERCRDRWCTRRSWGVVSRPRDTDLEVAFKAEDHTQEIDRSEKWAKMYSVCPNKTQANACILKKW